MADFSAADVLRASRAVCATGEGIHALTTQRNTDEELVPPKLSDRALAIFAFAAYHELESGTRVTSVVADDHAGHRADPSGVNELVEYELARREADHIAFTERGAELLQQILVTMRATPRVMSAGPTSTDRESS